MCEWSTRSVEIKLNDGPLDPGLRYFVERVPVPHAFQIAVRGKSDRYLPDVGTSGVRMVTAARFLSNLP